MEINTRALVEDRVLDAADLLEKVKKNLIIDHDKDDSLILGFIMGAVSYAESKQKKPDGMYAREPMTPTTEQAVIFLTSSFYESRDGGTAGFFADSAAANERSWEAIDRLLMLDKDWKF